METLIRPLEQTDKVEHFLSDGAHLNVWFHRKAKSLHLSKEVRTYVLIGSKIPESTEEKILGFYSTQAHGFYQEDHSGILLVKLAILIGHQRKGYGTQLLLDCFKKALALSEIVGCQGIIVHSKENAIPFYEERGFTMFDPINLGLFISIENISKVLNSQQ